MAGKTIGMVVHVVAQEEKSAVFRLLDECVPYVLVCEGVSFYSHNCWRDGVFPISLLNGFYKLFIVTDVVVLVEFVRGEDKAYGSS